MKDIPAHVARVLDEYKQRLGIAVGEVQKLLNVINAIEDDHQIPRTTPQGIPVQHNVSLGERVSVSGSVASHRPGAPIRPDEYLGEDPLKAAKKHLRRIGHALSLDQIADAIVSGGATPRESNWRDKLENSLIRSTSDVVKVADKTFGLTEFYSDEQLQNLRAARRPKPATPGRKRGRPRKQSKGSTAGRDSEDQQPLKLLRVSEGSKKPGPSE